MKLRTLVRRALADDDFEFKPLTLFELLHDFLEDGVPSALEPGGILSLRAAEDLQRFYEDSYHEPAPDLAPAPYVPEDPFDRAEAIEDAACQMRGRLVRDLCTTFYDALEAPLSGEKILFLALCPDSIEVIHIADVLPDSAPPAPNTTTDR